MRKQLILLGFLVACLIAPLWSQAGPIITHQRTYDFNSLPGGTQTASDGELLTVSNGSVRAAGDLNYDGWSGFINMAPSSYTDGNQTTAASDIPIRFDFSSPVRGIGMDWISAGSFDFGDPGPFTAITLNVFDMFDVLLQSLVMTPTDADVGYCISNQSIGTDFEVWGPCGFAGIILDSNQISYATIDTNMTFFEMYLDDIEYQWTTGGEPDDGGPGDGDPTQVPEPGTLALFGLGLVTMSLARRRKSARTVSN